MSKVELSGTIGPYIISIVFNSKISAFFLIFTTSMNEKFLS